MGRDENHQHDDEFLQEQMNPTESSSLFLGDLPVLLIGGNLDGFRTSASSRLFMMSNPSDDDRLAAQAELLINECASLSTACSRVDSVDVGHEFKSPSEKF